MQVPDTPSREWIIREDSHCQEERIERLQWLVTLYPSIDAVAFPGGLLTKQLFEEARYTFVYGQFAAAIFLSLAFVERCLAALFFAAGKDELARQRLVDLASRAHSAGILTGQEWQHIDFLRKVRNPLAHFREYGRPDTIEYRAVETIYSEGDDAMSPEEIVANDAVIAMELIMQMLATLCAPHSFFRFIALARTA